MESVFDFLVNSLLSPVVTDGLSDEPNGGLASAVVFPMSSISKLSACMDPEMEEVPVSFETPTVEEATIKAVWKPPPTKGFLQRGFFGPSTTSSPDVKVVSSLILAVKDDSKMGSPTADTVVQPSLLPLNTGSFYGSLQAPHTASMEGSLEFFGGSSSGAAELGERLCLSLPVMSECGASIYPSNSKSQRRYSRKVKGNIGS